MSISRGLNKLYPGHAIRGSFVVEDHLDGKGPRIVHWDKEALGPRPGEDTILVASREVVKERSLRLADRRRIKALIPKLKEGTASMAQVQRVLAHLLGD